MNPGGVPECGDCGTRLELRCPCDRPECALRTAVPFCPKCDKQKLDKWQTAHGVSVCGTYLEEQLR
jgi:hypothetical protein